MNHNLYAALRAAFPQNLNTTAIDTDDGLHYSWSDLERASAMMANLLDSLHIPKGSRVAVQVEKSVEAVMLYLATLRAGYVFLPLNTAYQSAEIEYFIGNAEPAVVVCSSKNFGWVSKIAFKAGTQNVFTLDDNRTGSLLERAAHCSDKHQVVQCKADDLAAILYTSGTTGRSKGAMLSHGNMLSNAQTLKKYWGWKPGDVLIHALPIFHVHGLFVAIHGALLNGSKMIWMSKFDPKFVIAKMPEATVFMGVPTLYVRMLAEPSLTKAQASNMRLFVAGSARWASHYPASPCACKTTKASLCPWVKLAAFKSKAPTCLAATGACPRKPKKSSRQTVISKPVMWARSMSAAMWSSWGAAKTSSSAAATTSIQQRLRATSTRWLVSLRAH